MASNLLPKFVKPPVVEVALSVQFKRLDITAAHLGLVWQQFRDRFPDIQEKPELDRVEERLRSQDREMAGVRFAIGVIPTPRYWFVSPSGNELVQVQRDRFVRNWRKTENDATYPSYEALRSSFVEDWTLFADFVQGEFQCQLSPNQCEVTYVNILEGMDSRALPKILAWVSGNQSDIDFATPEEAELTLRYLLQDDDGQPWGRLHVEAAPAIKASDNTTVVRLALTARGAPMTKDTHAVLNWFDKGHEAVVRGFTAVTTSGMHSEWGRTV